MTFSPIFLIGGSYANKNMDVLQELFKIPQSNPYSIKILEPYGAAGPNCDAQNTVKEIER